MVLAALLGLPLGALLSWASERVWLLASDAAKGRDDRSVHPSSREARSASSSFPWRGWRAPAVSFVTSGLLALLALRFDPMWAHLPVVVACLFFLLIAIVDLKYRIILNAVVLPVSGLVLLVRIVESPDSVPLALVGGLLGLLPFLLTAMAKPGGIGGGDVKLAALIGLLLGFPQVLWGISLGILSGGVFSVILLLFPHWERRDYIPYGPFLCLGAITALLYDPITPILLSLGR